MSTEQMFIPYLTSAGTHLPELWQILLLRLTKELMTSIPRVLFSAVWHVADTFCAVAVANGIVKDGSARQSATAKTEGQATRGIKMTWKLNNKPPVLRKRRIGGAAIFGLYQIDIDIIIIPVLIMELKGTMGNGSYMAPVGWSRIITIRKLL